MPAFPPLLGLSGHQTRRHQGAVDLRAGLQLKEELGLDHFEGQSWQGLHRHALMTMIAYAFLQHRRLAAGRRRKKKKPRASAAADFARRAPRNPRALRSTTAAAMPALPKMDLQRAAA